VLVPEPYYTPPFDESMRTLYAEKYEGTVSGDCWFAENSAIKKPPYFRNDGLCITVDRFDYSAGVGSTSVSVVAVGFTVGFDVTVALAFAEALAEADGVMVGDADDVASTACLTTQAAPRLIPTDCRCRNN
jgi:hypothetical protein